MSRRKNLLLAFDAFDTLFHPKIPIQEQYGAAAIRHGITQSQWGDHKNIMTSFKKAFKEESEVNPNYGRATGLGAENWWRNIITKTFQPFLRPEQEVPQALVSDLITRFSTKQGYNLYPDVIPFFQMLREAKQNEDPRWRWDRTIVGVITNSDSRVPGILESLGLKVGPLRFGDEVPANSGAEVANEDISFVVLSYDVGFEKPDRHMFDAAVQMTADIMAAENADVSVDDFAKLYVGDSIENDFIGARNAGWDSRVLNRSNGEDNADVVSDLRKLRDWVPL